ncbi:hypothetical protein K502DRAFT_325793 [Neoconidiobolus thromboides FSU 785]|nr:hypothetical protein K502DRAFT_325793 [Neoconidiobolus thromboides FSU 785]
MHQNKVHSLYRSLLRSGRQSLGDSNRGLRPMKLKLRQGFEENKTLNLKEAQEKLERGYKTLQFLKVAADKDSTEHRIVKSLCIMEHYQESYSIRPPVFGKKVSESRKKAYSENYDNYLRMIEMLNKTEGLALR